MTETVEGVRDPLRVSHKDENVLIRSSILPKGHDDILCPVDDEGYVRWPEGRHSEGEIVPWHSYTILNVDVESDKI